MVVRVLRCTHSPSSWRYLSSAALPDRINSRIDCTGRAWFSISSLSGQEHFNNLRKNSLEFAFYMIWSICEFHFKSSGKHEQGFGMP